MFWDEGDLGLVDNWVYVVWCLRFGVLGMVNIGWGVLVGLLWFFLVFRILLGWRRMMEDFLLGWIYLVVCYGVRILEFVVLGIFWVLGGLRWKILVDWMMMDDG